MDPYVRLCEELFSAAKTEFKHLEYFYFTIVFMIMFGKITEEGMRKRLQPMRLSISTRQTTKLFL